MTERLTGLRPGVIGAILLTGLLALPAAAQVMPGGAPTIRTEPATGATSASVVMHGIVFPNGGPAAVWFEYGTGPELGSVSPIKQIGTEFQSTRVNFYLYRVQPGATYYFRMAGRNAYGDARGETLSVNVPVPGTAKQAPYSGGVSPSAGSASGPGFFYRSWPSLGGGAAASSTAPDSGTVSLAASVDNPNPKPGDVFTYALTYRSGSSRASQAHLRVTVPAELEFLGAQPAPAVSGDQLDFDLGALNSGIQETLSVPFRVRPSVRSGASVTIAARLDYLEGTVSRSANANFTILAGQASQTAAVSGVLPLPGQWYIWVALGFLVMLLVVAAYLAYRYLRVRRSFKA